MWTSDLDLLAQFHANHGREVSSADLALIALELGDDGTTLAIAANKTALNGMRLAVARPFVRPPARVLDADERHARWAALDPRVFADNNVPQSRGGAHTNVASQNYAHLIYQGEQKPLPSHLRGLSG